jgi:3-deoxy-7-phosphoheptulonate synthase
MAFQPLQAIPSPETIKEMIPLSQELAEQKAFRDEKIRDLFLGKSDRFLLIIGPCSADHPDAVREYVTRLAKVQDNVKDKILIVPRIYTNKPRTTGEGYKGMMHSPNPIKKPDLVEGIKAIRNLQIQIMKDSGLSAADEMLYPMNLPYVDDLLSYIAVGARSVENQKHRLVASGIDIPVGMKNPTSGDLTVMLNSIRAAQIPHTFIFNNMEVKSTGNPIAHAILRGAVNQHGQNIPNYHYEDLNILIHQYAKRGLENPAIIIDCNHANSSKDFMEQPRIALEVLANRRHNRSIENAVKGLMIESYLEDGNQDLKGGVFGKSITDSCLGWGKTETLIYRLADKL